MAKIISRKEALAKGLKRYFTGKYCINNHHCERYINGSCIECDSVKSSKYYATTKGKDKRSSYFKKYSKTEKGKEINRKWTNIYDQSTKGKENNKIYKRIRRSRDPGYKIRGNVSNRVKAFLKIKGKPKNKSLYKSIGCTNIFLKEWIEKKFKKGMNWNNHGTVWNIDHIKPVSKFKIENIERANHYTNLQPLFWRENIIKGNK